MIHSSRHPHPIDLTVFSEILDECEETRFSSLTQTIARCFAIRKDVYRFPEAILSRLRLSGIDRFDFTEVWCSFSTNRRRIDYGPMNTDLKSGDAERSVKGQF
jgi:hypothetical protein